MLLFHGYTADKSTLTHEAQAFLDLGCSVLLVDFRGSGESSESYTTIGYLEGLDVVASVKVEEARAVFDAVPGTKEFKEFPEASHEPALARSPADWRAAVAPFLAPTPQP